MKSESSCPTCKNEKFDAIDKPRSSENQKATELFAGRSIVQCTVCGLKRLHPFPTDAELQAYYKNYRSKDGISAETPFDKWGHEYDLQYSAKAVGSLNFVSMNLAGSLKDAKRILEIGPGLGEFLRLLKEFFPHISLHAFEPDTTLTSFLRSKDIRVCSAMFDPSSYREFGGDFDLIVMQMVLEHVKDPLETLGLCHALLKSNGHLFIQVPNYNDDVFFERNGDDGHLLYFTEKSLNETLNRSEFSTAFISPCGPFWGERQVIQSTPDQSFKSKLISRAFQHTRTRLNPILNPSLKNHWYENYIYHPKGNTIQSLYRKR